MVSLLVFRYIYNHKSCGRCGSAISTWIIQARTCYACLTCQPLQAGTELNPERAKILAAATGTKVAFPPSASAFWNPRQMRAEGLTLNGTLQKNAPYKEMQAVCGTLQPPCCADTVWKAIY